MTKRAFASALLLFCEPASSQQPIGENSNEHVALACSADQFVVTLFEGMNGCFLSGEIAIQLQRVDSRYLLRTSRTVIDLTPQEFSSILYELDDTLSEPEKPFGMSTNEQLVELEVVCGDSIQTRRWSSGWIDQDQRATSGFPRFHFARANALARFIGDLWAFGLDPTSILETSNSQ